MTARPGDGACARRRSLSAALSRARRGLLAAATSAALLVTASHAQELILPGGPPVEQAPADLPPPVPPPPDTPPAVQELPRGERLSDSKPTETAEPVEKVATGAEMLVALERRGDLTLRNSSLSGALFTISELWGINIVAGSVEGSVNGVFKDAPLREILDSILLSNGYGYRSVGASLVVSKLEQLGQVNPFMVSATIPVSSASVEDVVEGAKLLVTPAGQIRPIPSARSIFVLDFPDRVQMIREFVTTIDAAARGEVASGAVVTGPRQLEVSYFRIHFIDVEQARLLLTPVLSQFGKASSLMEERRLLVVDYPENLRMIETVLDRVDRPRPQVNIKALIYDISLNDLEELGVNWGSRSGGSVDATTGTPASGTGLLANSVTKQPFGAAENGGSFTLFSLNSDFDLRAVALALQSASDSRLLADPNVTVLDNEEAKIESVSEIPYQQLTQSQFGGSIGTTAFKNAGITLQVTPRIAHDGTIDMIVTPEFSRLAGFTPGDNQPIIDKRSATTRVRVANQQLIAIGGLRQRTDVGDFRGIPGLKDVRYLGKLFRTRETEIRESELMVFLSPEIVGYCDPVSHREQQVADTIGCRLNAIPEAEGCPCCGNCGIPGCGECGAPMLAPGEGGEISHMRRLPPTATAQTDQGIGGEIGPLRTQYNRRFHAAGGVDPESQRPETSGRVASPPPAAFWR